MVPALRLQTNFNSVPSSPKRKQPDEVERDNSNEKWGIPIHIVQDGEDDDDDDAGTDFELDDDNEEDDDDKGAREVTPRAQLDRSLPQPSSPMRWNSFSIDEMLHEDGGLHDLGPATPNEYEDISPITRGEWGFLMGDKSGRQVGITTCY